MARKYMTKEVTSTIVKLAKVEVGENGLPTVVELPSVTMMGNISKEKAQKLANKNHDEAVTVFAVEVVTATYKMKVTDFIKMAELVTDGDTSVDEDDEEEEESAN